jgi:hypothetical protein
MSFGHFLNGVAQGLDYGVEAGDRITAARDRKKVRDAGKQTAKDNKLFEQMATAGAEQMPGAPLAPSGATIASQNRANLASTQAPRLVAGGQPPTTSPNPMPAPRPRPVALPGDQEGYEPPIAASLGVQPQIQYDARFPAGIAGSYGVMGGPPPYQQYPYQY